MELSQVEEKYTQFYFEHDYGVQLAGGGTLEYMWSEKKESGEGEKAKCVHVMKSSDRKEERQNEDQKMS